MSNDLEPSPNTTPNFTDELKLLEDELKTFDDNASPALSSHLTAVSSVCHLFEDSVHKPVKQNNENRKSERGLSKQNLSIRSKVRNLLEDIFVSLGQEVFFLCIISITISKLGKIKPEYFIPQLRIWWHSANPWRPRGLTTVAAKLCQPLQELIHVNRKRKFSELGIQGTC